MPDRSCGTPNPTISLIPKALRRVFFSLTHKVRYYCNHLIMADSLFRHKLIVPHAGIVIPHLYNPVKDVLTVLPLIERQVVFFEFIRQGRQYNLIPAILQ